MTTVYRKPRSIDAIQFKYKSETDNNIEDVKQFLLSKNKERYSDVEFNKFYQYINIFGIKFENVNNKRYIEGNDWLYFDYNKDIVTICYADVFKDEFTDEEFDVSDDVLEDQFKCLIYDFSEIDFDIIKTESFNSYINKSEKFNKKQLETLRSFVFSLYSKLNEQ